MDHWMQRHSVSVTIETDISFGNLLSFEILNHVAGGGHATPHDVGAVHLQRIVAVYFDLNSFY